MGLSTKQVSSNGVDWTRTLLQAQSPEVPKSPTLRRQLGQNQHPPEKCPRCDSMNTKFCYYNNYNKSQPRHFCKTCKRHWTKGGTLRNVPVGGGRKNKRLQTVNNNVANIGSSNKLNSDNMAMQSQQKCQNPSLLHGDDKTIFETQYHLLQSSTNCSSIRGTSLGLNSSFPQNYLPFFSLPSSSGSFQSNLFPVSTSNQPLTPDAFPAEETNIMKDSTFTTFMPISSCSVVTQPCELPSMSHSDMGMTSFLTWEEIDNLVTSDLNTWNDSEITVSNKTLNSIK